MNRSFARKVSIPEALVPSLGGVGAPAQMMSPQRGTGSALVLSKDEMLSKEALVMTAGHVGVGLAIGAFAAKAVGVTLLGGVGVALAVGGVAGTWYLKNKAEEV